MNKICKASIYTRYFWQPCERPLVLSFEQAFHRKLSHSIHFNTCVSVLNLNFGIPYQNIDFYWKKRKKKNQQIYKLRHAERMVKWDKTNRLRFVFKSLFLLNAHTTHEEQQRRQRYQFHSCKTFMCFPSFHSHFHFHVFIIHFHFFVRFCLFPFGLDIHTIRIRISSKQQCTHNHTITQILHKKLIQFQFFIEFHLILFQLKECVNFSVYRLSFHQRIRANIFMLKTNWFFYVFYLIKKKSTNFFCLVN